MRQNREESESAQSRRLDGPATSARSAQRLRRFPSTQDAQLEVSPPAPPSVIAQAQSGNARRL
jgi:hypothetical protein